jgi:hypothetical protein
MAVKISQIERILLGVTVGIDGGAVLCLAARNLYLTTTAIDTLGSVILLVIGGANWWALYAIAFRQRSWVTASILSQFFIVPLALYVVLIDLRSPYLQFLGITGIAIAMGAIAIFWTLRFIRYASTALAKRGVAFAAALVPLAGLLQYWLDTDYLPRTSRPFVDITGELKPISRIGDKVNLAAKITLHNGGKVQVNGAGGIIRITGYPYGQFPLDVPDAFEVVAGTRPEEEIRAEPTPGSKAHLLFADEFMVADNVVPPGETITTQKIVSVDWRAVRLVRLTVTAAFVTDRQMMDLGTCIPPKIRRSTDNSLFRKKVSDIHQETVGSVNGKPLTASYLCVDNYFAPRNVVRDLVSDHPILRSFLELNNPLNAQSEYPRLIILMATPQTVDRTARDWDYATHLKVERDNPTLIFSSDTEYAPGAPAPGDP